MVLVGAGGLDDSGVGVGCCVLEESGCCCVLVLSELDDVEDCCVPASARRIVPELSELAVSAVLPVSESERMLWHPISPAPTSVDASIAIKCLLFISPPRCWSHASWPQPPCPRRALAEDCACVFCRRLANRSSFTGELQGCCDADDSGRHESIVDSMHDDRGKQPAAAVGQPCGAERNREDGGAVVLVPYRENDSLDSARARTPRASACSDVRIRLDDLVCLEFARR
jgi:hypothetical protein